MKLAGDDATKTVQAHYFAGERCRLSQNREGALHEFKEACQGESVRLDEYCIARLVKIPFYF